LSIDIRPNPAVSRLELSLLALWATANRVLRVRLTSLCEKLIKIGAKAVSHARYVTSQMIKVAVPRQMMLADILSLIARLRVLPAPQDARSNDRGLTTTRNPGNVGLVAPTIVAVAVAVAVATPIAIVAQRAAQSTADDPANDGCARIDRLGIVGLGIAGAIGRRGG